MGIFSLFSSHKTVKNDIVHGHTVDYGKYLDRDFFSEIIDSSDSMMLYFFQGDGWIGANRTFFKVLDFKNIEEFIAK